jgi:pimeloyl-ACP methyl ester carboxylesterase
LALRRRREKFWACWGHLFQQELPKIKTISLALAIALASTVCGVPTQPLYAAAAKQDQRRGSVISVESLGKLSQVKLQKMTAQLPGSISVTQGVDLFRVIYWTVYKGKPVKASGLFATPDGGAPAKGVMMYLHGTNNTRSMSPSQAERVDGDTEAAVFGGNGYYVVLPDYIGLGVSYEPHPYIITKPLVDDSIDLLKAVRQIVKDRNLSWSPNLFMMGFSQGGQIVAGVHRELDRRPLAGYRLRGSAGVAGPYELRKTSAPKASESECLKCVGYLAWGVYAYSTYYEHPLNTTLKPAYIDVVPKLFDGSKTVGQIGAALPAKPEDMFQPKFLKEMRSNGDNWFTKGLDSNETYRWAPVAPFRLYIGEADLDVTPASSRTFYNHAKARGGNISLHSLGQVDHQTSIDMTYAPVLKWLEELLLVD